MAGSFVVNGDIALGKEHIFFAYIHREATLEIEAKMINRLGEFCGIRDVGTLSNEEIYRKIGSHKADVMVLFGGSILCGGDVLANAIRSDIAKIYMIVGGAGHTTPSLRKRFAAVLPELVTKDRSEAEMFDDYLRIRYGVSADLLETRSTNCGNNITFMLDLLKERNISCQGIILVQDATMQRRMAAGLRMLRPGMKIINYAAYHATVVEHNRDLQYAEDIPGMWDIKQYTELLLGEIKRLRDDEKGYGPKGKGFIAHEEIPDEIEEAFEKLSAEYMVRKANPEFAS